MSRCCANHACQFRHSTQPGLSCASWLIWTDFSPNDPRSMIMVQIVSRVPGRSQPLSVYYRSLLNINLHNIIVFVFVWDCHVILCRAVFMQTWLTRAPKTEDMMPFANLFCRPLFPFLSVSWPSLQNQDGIYWFGARSIDVFNRTSNISWFEFVVGKWHSVGHFCVELQTYSINCPMLSRPPELHWALLPVWKTLQC